MKPHRPQNTDVGDFINSKLREIDNDPVQPPYDSLQEVNIFFYLKLLILKQSLIFFLFLSMLTKAKVVCTGRL